ncbi:glutathione S-transferase [Rhizophagus diaphanus]|nr:glutathione S-transferase [Rhizophagus diaphanus] [Rhizophagus sp. MUCL 43196]
MTIQVYGFSTYAQSLVVIYVLKELGLSYEVIQPASLEEIKSPEYLATKHPFGKMPVLNDDGFQIANYYNQPIAKMLTQLILAKKLGNEVDLKIVNEAREELDKNLDVYEKLLEDKDYLTGEFSLVDFLHIPSTFYAFKAGEGELWNKRPNVSRWWKNISERESWKSIVTEYKLDEVV